MHRGIFGVYAARLFIATLLVFFCLFLADGCFSQGKNHLVQKPLGYNITHREIGIASWYGPGFHGKITANGEVFSKNKLTAAHRNLPFGTLARVKSIQTERSVIVRINDRGPFMAGRIIDLSEEAARRIGIKKQGIGVVALEVLQSLAIK